MSRYSLLFIVALFLGGCVSNRPTTPAPDWRTRRESIDFLIKTEASVNAYDSADVYQRGGFYYAARRDRGDFLYSPVEAKEQLLDSVVIITTPTHSYQWEFDKGLPNGRWIYMARATTALFIVETYRKGELLKREKFKDGPPPYLVEIYRDGQLIEKKGVDNPLKK